MNTKDLGDLAKTQKRLVSRGYSISFPFGEVRLRELTRLRTMKYDVRDISTCFITIPI